jgi:hypothetical protein
MNMTDEELAQKLYQSYFPGDTLNMCGDETRYRWIQMAAHARWLLAEDQRDQPDAGRVTLWRMTLSAALVGRENSMTDAIVLANAAIDADKSKWGGQ